MLTILIIFQLVTFAFLTTSATEECAYVDYLGKTFNITEVGCPSNHICNEKRVIKVTYIEIPLYFYRDMRDDEHQMGKEHKVLQKPVHGLLRRCCGTCANIQQVKILNNTGELSLASMNGSDFIYPILSTASREKMYGYYYLPFVDVPDMMYISEPPEVGLLNLLVHVYPICIVSVLLCVVAGFVGWLCEYQRNEEEFPRGFLIGWYEGVWWAFVSMTTVRKSFKKFPITP